MFKNTLKSTVRKKRKMNPEFWTIIAILATVIVGLGPYLLSRQLKAPKVGNFEFLGQAAYEIKGIDLEDNSPAFSGGYGFPTTKNSIFRRGPNTQAAIFHFDLTNTSFVAMRITKVWIEVTRYSKGKIYVGMGEMVAGGNEMKFEVELDGGEGKQECQWINSEFDYIKIPSNDFEAFEIYVRSSVPGLYEMRPIVEYVQLGRKKELILDASDFPVIFFEGNPPPYAQLIEPIASGQRR